MIYNQLGQDHFYHLDYKKANKWEIIDHNPKIPSWQNDIRQHQYIIIYLDIENMGDTFTKVKDLDTILLLTCSPTVVPRLLNVIGFPPVVPS